MLVCYLIVSRHTLPGRSLDKPLIKKLTLINWFGANLFIGAGILLLLSLSWGSTVEWKSTRVVVTLVVGVLVFIGFVLWNYILAGLDRNRENQYGRRTTDPSGPAPMIPLSLFPSYSICALVIVSFVSGAVMIVVFYFSAIFLSIITGLSAFQVGRHLIYFTPGMVRPFTYLIVVSDILFLRSLHYREWVQRSVPS
jgi:hypothetical protein